MQTLPITPSQKSSSYTQKLPLRNQQVVILLRRYPPHIPLRPRLHTHPEPGAVARHVEPAERVLADAEYYEALDGYYARDVL